MPRVRSVAQYLVNDDANVNGFQSGLRFVTGRAKPSLGAYRLPIWVRAGGSSVTVFGQVRPAADSARETVLVQNRALAGVSHREAGVSVQQEGILHCEAVQARRPVASELDAARWLGDRVPRGRSVAAMTRRALKPLLPVLALAGLLAGAVPAAHADGTLELSIEDNNVLFNPADAAATVPKWKALGVDSVRLAARWNRIAPSVISTNKPGGFNGANPSDSRYKWAELDNAISVLNANGLKAMILIPNSGPLWASEKPALHIPEFKPKPDEFSAFAQAVVKRYRARGVQRYLLGNEANQSFFLKPQLECKRGKCTDFSPSHYRKMLLAAYPKVKALQPGAQFLIGELAPIGSTVRNSKSSLKPLAFLRGLGCLDKSFKKITTGPCKGFKPAKGDGFGFHPYQVKQPPSAKQTDPDLVKLGDLDKLFKTLDKLTGAGRLKASTGRFNVYLTEFGYETRPPTRATASRRRSRAPTSRRAPTSPGRRRA